ncbi:MAG: prepilin-type N-terminal cleavage/methylation domain-containing protein [Fibromonadales bacterium]|nr:prepilin-type N-terminal cleavage/methylation domain-containing protein [Fibromonadales bacterium]
MKRAFTLIELLVYMAIMSFIIIVAGRVFSDSTVMRVRSQNMIKNNEEVGRVSSLIKEDISQMGIKAWGHNAGSDDYTVRNIGTAYQEIYWDKTNGDVSSYALRHRTRTNTTPTTYYDNITFRKTAFDEQGRFLGIREIIWEATEDSLLFRRCATIKSKCPYSNDACGTTDIDLSVCPEKTSAKDADPVLIAKNIVNFKIIPSAPEKDDNSGDILFGGTFKLLSRSYNPTDKVEVATVTNVTNSLNTETETTVSDFAQNLNSGTGDKLHNELYLAKSNKNNFTECEPLSFKKGETYSIEFKMPYSIPTSATAEQLQQALSSTQFVPTRDHLAIGLRRTSDWKTPEGAPKDMLFYPAQSEFASDLTRHLEFSVSKDIKATDKICMVIIIAYYPPKNEDKFNSSKGLLRFSNFKIFRNADKTFRFLKEGDTGYHKDYGTEDMTTLPALAPALDTKIKQKTNAKAFELTLEIENKSEKSGTSFIKENKEKGMVITTPNNGVIPKEDL